MNISARLKTLAGYLLILAAGLGAGLALAKLPKLLEKPYQEGDYSRYFPDARTKVVVYGTSTCPYCAKARNYLKRKNIAYADFNVDESDQARSEFQSLKGVGVPVILVGNRLITGFKPDAIDDAIRAASR